MSEWDKDRDRARFYQRVRTTPDCWLWTGERRGRYGLLHHLQGQPEVAAHRLSWELHRGPIPSGMWVCHHCDVPLCVNPDHLFLGNRFDNMRDAGSKGRICTVGKSRLTHCKRGHEFTVENTYINPKGHRICRTCTGHAAAIRADVEPRRSSTDFAPRYITSDGREVVDPTPPQAGEPPK